MTASDDRPQMLPEQFEEFARRAAHPVEGLRLEFLGGKPRVKAGPDGDHGRALQWLTRVCMQARPELWLHDQGLKVQAYRAGRARPDGALADSEAFVGAGEWAEPEPVLMAVEVTSYDADTDRRDRADKPRAYAESGIPVYLLIDRASCEVTVYARPDGVRYEHAHTVPFGRKVELPSPVGITLETEPLKNWVR
ncbi:Uma2 family endonuclease [Streptomyces sp. JJ66]|uniref:Uma2 family endonuclease n=1 Tax=Streptomyces sp. JJ66 TaxID=2803843 RepID=UPI001C581D54|nr:Uma2 family endonuclease [Streptomyces sp. JJ66]MBW1603814.1 Uma2 family endonuclease [Streptomyces sp. JJ66]